MYIYCGAGYKLKWAILSFLMGTERVLFLFFFYLFNLVYYEEEDEKKRRKKEGIK